MIGLGLTIALSAVGIISYKSIRRSNKLDELQKRIQCMSISLF